MALTDLKFKKAAPKEKTYLINDGDGLHLEVKPSGKKHWRFRYWLNGKENRMSLGEYPLITLEKARKLLDEKRKLVAEGIDPVEAKREAKAAVSIDHTFEGIAREWLKSRADGVDEKTTFTNLRRLEV